MINNLDINDFLKNYWQKKPLLIRSAFPNYQPPISPDELAGLACEEYIESRIIFEKDVHPKWHLENGPFPESRFSELPKTHWTILIQGLNKVIPELDDLLHLFNFIPSWRIDDLMASYAAPEGSVGPHIDQYDVFLLQASGQRKWMINDKEIIHNEFEADTPLKILKEFKPNSEWILEAGDMLYLPPNIAHHGIGLENCMTFSIGFRAPSHAELLSAYIDDHIIELNDNLRYKDPTLSDQLNSGEISTTTIEEVQKILLQQFNDQNKIKDWFGCFITDYLNNYDNQNIATLNITQFSTQLNHKKTLRRPPSVRANYLVDKDNHLSLYINGKIITIDSQLNEFARLYCNQHIYHYEEIRKYINNKNVINFLYDLYSDGNIEFSNE